MDIWRIKYVAQADPRLLFKKRQKLINKSFYLKGNNGTAVLLLHGWTSTSYELRSLGEFLNSSGFTIYAPMLCGHGTVFTDLEGIKAQDWINDAKKAYSKLKKNYSRIFVGGTSIGGSLSLILAQEGFKIDGLILMATPYKFKFERLSYWITKACSKIKKYNRKFYPPTFGAKQSVTRLISYQRYPYESVFEAYELIKISRENLHNITQPCLILQSYHDHIMKQDSIDRIYQGIKSKLKKKKLLYRTYHTFISDVRNKHVFKDVLDFLKQH